jgi:hypothetical protein
MTDGRARHSTHHVAQRADDVIRARLLLADVAHDLLDSFDPCGLLGRCVGFEDIALDAFQEKGILARS